LPKRAKSEGRVTELGWGHRWECDRGSSTCLQVIRAVGEGCALISPHMSFSGHPLTMYSGVMWSHTEGIRVLSRQHRVLLLRSNTKSSVVVHTCNPSTWEAEAGGSWVWSQSVLHTETASHPPQPLNKGDRVLAGCWLHRTSTGNKGWCQKWEQHAATSGVDSEEVSKVEDTETPTHPGGHSAGKIRTSTILVPCWLRSPPSPVTSRADTGTWCLLFSFCPACLLIWLWGGAAGD
jgi:hypothetical protein